MQPHPRKTQPPPISRVATGTQPAKHKGHKELVHLAGKEVRRGLLRFDSWRFSLKVFKDGWDRAWRNLASCPWQGVWNKRNFKVCGSVI